MAEFSIQEKMNSYIAQHSELKGKSDAVILSAMMKEGLVTQAEIDSAKSTSTFGFGFSKTGDTGLLVESDNAQNTDSKGVITDGTKQFVDADGNNIVMKYSEGLLVEKTVSKDNIQTEKLTYSYEQNECVVINSENKDKSKTVIITKNIDENGNVPDKDFVYSETTKADGTVSSIYMTIYGMTKEEVKPDYVQTKTLYATYNYSDIENNKAEKVSETVQNPNGNAAITTYKDGVEVDKYAQVVLIKGETLSELAQKYGTTLEEIKELNPNIEDINKIKSGEKILIANKSNLPAEATTQRKVQKQIVYEGYLTAYNNIIAKQNKQVEVNFPVDINGKQTDKFNNLQDAAIYVLSLNNVKNPTKEQMDICTKELTILNSSGEEKSLNKRANAALDNINSGKLVYVSGTDFSAELSRCGFEPTPENYEFYQKFYAVREQLLNICFGGAEGDVYAAREIFATLENILKEEGAKQIGDPEKVKYRILTECGINLYEEEKAQEAEDILKRKMALDLSSNVYEYLYKANENIVNSGSISRDIQNLLEEGLDAIAQKFGKDVYTRKEYIEDLKKVSDTINLISETDLSNSEEFNKLFSKFYGVEYNQEKIEELSKILSDNKEKNFDEILKDKEFQKLFKEAFNIDLKSKLTDLKVSEMGSKIIDIMIMVVAFQVIAKSPAIQNFSLKTASTLNNIGLTGKWLQVAQAAMVGGTNFATYTTAEKMGDLLLRGEELNPQNSEKIAENIFESFAFGSFAGAFNVLAVAPLTQQRTVQYAVQEVEKAMTEGTVKTGTEVMELFYKSQAPVISSKIGQAVYSFGANVAGFTAYNTAKDMVQNMDMVKELGFGKYLGKQALAQLEGLATFEGVKMLLAFAMSGKIGMESAMSVKEGLEPFETIKNMTIETIESNGQICYKVSYPKGEPVVVGSMGEVVGLCQQWMVAEFNMRNAYNPEAQAQTNIETGNLALPMPEGVTAEGVTRALVKPQAEVKELATENSPEEIIGLGYGNFSAQVYEKSLFKEFNEDYQKVKTTDEMVDLLKKWVPTSEVALDSYKDCDFNVLKRTVALIIKESQRTGAIDGYELNILSILNSNYIQETKDFQLIEKVLGAKSNDNLIDAVYADRLSPLIKCLQNESDLDALRRMLAIESQDDFLNIDNILHIVENYGGPKESKRLEFLENIEKPGADIEFEFKKLLSSEVLDYLQDDPRLTQIYLDYAKDLSAAELSDFIIVYSGIEHTFNPKTGVKITDKAAHVKKQIRSELDFESKLNVLGQTLEQTLGYVQDNEVKDLLLADLQKIRTEFANDPKAQLAKLNEIQSVIDAINIANGKYTNIKRADGSVPYYRDFINYLENNNPSLAKKVTKDPSILERIFKTPSYKTMREDFKLDMRIGKIVEVCKNDPNGVYANHLYEHYYLQSTNISPEIKARLKTISERFGTKVFLSEKESNIEGCLDYIERELAEWTRVSGGKAKMPPTIDLMTSKRDYVDSTAAYGKGKAAGLSEMSKSGAISLNGNDYYNILYALRHEITHTNDQNPDAELPENPQQYTQEFLNAGISIHHVDYAFNNSKEFIAVASEGDFSKYSPEFKRLLVELGMPEWELSMRTRNETVETPVEQIHGTEAKAITSDVPKTANTQKAGAQENATVDTQDAEADEVIIEDYTVNSVDELRGKLSSKNRSQLKFKGQITIEDDNTITNIEKVNGVYRVITTVKPKSVSKTEPTVEQMIARNMALYAYCFSPKYKEINKALEALANNEPISEEMQTYIRNLEDLIESQPAAQAGSTLVVHRQELTTWALKELEKAYGKNVEDIKPEDIALLTQPHFLSTSKRKSGGYAIVTGDDKPKVIYELQVNEGCQMLDVMDYMGDDFFGENEKFANKVMQDAEIIFQRGTIIKVNSIEKNSDGCYVVKGSLLPGLR